MKNDKIQPQYSEKNLCQCHLVHHKSQTDWPKTAPGFRGERPVTHCLNYGMPPLPGPHSLVPFTRLLYKLTDICPCASSPEILQLFFQYTSASTGVNGCVSSTIKPRVGKRNIQKVDLYIRNGIKKLDTCARVVNLISNKKELFNIDFGSHRESRLMPSSNARLLLLQAISIKR